MTEAIAGLRRALLVMHSPVDNVVGISNATAIFTAAKHPKSFVSLDRADHLLGRAEDSRYAAGVIANWARKYIREQQGEVKLASPGDNRVVVRTGATGYRTEILANGHPLVADEPVSVGGTNTGPSPYELLAAALRQREALDALLADRPTVGELRPALVTAVADKRFTAYLGNGQAVDIDWEQMNWARPRFWSTTPD